MVCGEIEFLRKVASNVIVSPRKQKMYVTLPKDDEALEKIRKFFGGRFVGYKESFRGRNYLVEVNGIECDELKELIDSGAINITVAMKKPTVSVIVASEDAIERIKQKFDVITVKDAIKGVNYSVKVRL